MGNPAACCGVFIFASMKFSVGDTVAYLNTTGTGTVREVKGVEVLVADENGFDNWHHERELVIRKRMEVGEVPQKDSPRPATTGNKPLRPGTYEKDLHFPSLVDFPKNYTNRQMLDIQVNAARNAIDHARRSGIKKVILIHGVGEGILREEIHRMLERMDKLQFYDASYDKYGSGATEVELF